MTETILNLNAYTSKGEIAIQSPYHLLDDFSYSKEEIEDRISWTVDGSNKIFFSCKKDDLKAYFGLYEEEIQLVETAFHYGKRFGHWKSWVCCFCGKVYPKILDFKEHMALNHAQSHHQGSDIVVDDDIPDPKTLHLTNSEVIGSREAAVRQVDKWRKLREERQVLGVKLYQKLTALGQEEKWILDFSQEDYSVGLHPLVKSYNERGRGIREHTEIFHNKRRIIIGGGTCIRKETKMPIFQPFDLSLPCQMCDETGHSPSFCPLHCQGFYPEDAPVKSNIQITCWCCNDRKCYLRAMFADKNPFGYASFKNCIRCSDEHDAFLCPFTVKYALCRDVDCEHSSSRAFYVENLSTDVTEFELYRHFRKSPYPDVDFVSMHHDLDTGKCLGYVAYSHFKAADALKWGNGDGSQFNTNIIIKCYPSIF